MCIIYLFYRDKKKKVRTHLQILVFNVNPPLFLKIWKIGSILLRNGGLAVGVFGLLSLHTLMHVHVHFNRPQTRFTVKAR